MRKYLEKYKLLSAHQSGFWANDPFVYQLLSTVHIYLAFDAYPTLKSQGVFLDMSKAGRVAYCVKVL